MKDAAAPADTAATWRDLLRPALASRFAFLCLGIWLNAADALVTVTLTPTIAAEIGGFQHFGWSIAAFLLGAIVAGVCSGRLSLEIGLRPAIAVAGVAYAAGCALSALAPDFLVFVAGRLVQGLGAGAIAALCYVAINAMFPEGLWVRILSALAGVWGAATLLGPLIGGLFAQADWWRGAFWFFAAQGLIFVGATFLLVKRPPRSEGDATPRIPIPQLLILALGVALIASAGATRNIALDLGFAVCGVVCVWLLLRLDARAGGVLLPKSAGNLATAAGAGYFVIFAMEAATIAFSVYGPAFVQVLHEATPLVAGYVITAVAAGWTVAAFAVSGVHNRDGFMIRLGATGVLAGLALSAWAVPYGTLWMIVGALALAGVGFGMSWAFLSKRVIASLSDAERPLGSSAVPTAQMIGGAVGAAAASSVAAALGFAEGVDPETGRQAGFWLFASFVPLAILGWVAAWRLGGMRVED